MFHFAFCWICLTTKQTLPCESFRFTFSVCSVTAPPSQTGKPCKFYRVNKDLNRTHTSTAGTMSMPTVRNSSNFRKGLKQLPTSRRRILPSCESELQHKHEGRTHVSGLLTKLDLPLSYNIHHVLVNTLSIITLAKDNSWKQLRLTCGWRCMAVESQVALSHPLPDWHFSHPFLTFSSSHHPKSIPGTRCV